MGWERKIVVVNLDHLDDGSRIPQVIYYEDDETKEIRTFVVDACRGPERRAARGGGYGLRYEVIISCEGEGIHRKRTFLYFEEGANPEVWFVDKKV